MSKVAFVVGITGQDGSYLAEFLLSQGYTVHGLIRPTSTANTSRIDHLCPNLENSTTAKLLLHYGDLSQSSQLGRLLEEIAPDEVYNLGAQSHVQVSFELPAYTSEINGLGAVRLLEAIRKIGSKCRFYQASSSEMFGNAPAPQNEETLFQPLSPYATAKLFAYGITRNYRESYGLFTSNGILFNHESPRRGEAFVSRKITLALANIIAGKQKRLYLGNLDSCRDWGYAPEYVEGMWQILQQDIPQDFVLGTGESHTVRDFVQAAFSYVDLDWQEYVSFDAKYLRPMEISLLRADATKAKKLLAWQPRITFDELVKIMVDADLARLGLPSPGVGSQILAKKNFRWLQKP